MKTQIAMLVILGLIKAVFSAPAEDKVDYLPDMTSFDDWAVYSGYVNITNTTKNIHYLFLESQNNTAEDPLVIWFNGGPGCSSMLGFISEHGPYVILDGEDSFTKNPYSWNLEANMLYIEQPAGVGYSYCNHTSNPEDCIFNDTSSGADNLQVVLSWFELFPEYKLHDLYISGESYGGIYVPYLANNIHDHNEKNRHTDIFKPNLKGFIVGNGVTNWTVDTEPAFIEMGFWHSLYDTGTYDKMD